MVGIAGLYRELHAAAAASRRGRALADAEADAFRVGPAQEQAAVRRAALRIVAMGAIDVEIGAGALFERAGRRIVPARHRHRRFRGLGKEARKIGAGERGARWEEAT